MWGPVLLVLVSCTFAQRLPDPPRVTVDPAVLEKFGITENVNQPGLFQHLVSITPSINSTDPQLKVVAEQAQQDIHSIYSNMLSMSAIHITTGIIKIYQPLPEGPLAQFIAAHILNLYTRLYDILNKIDDDAIEALSKFVGSEDSGHRLTLCINSPIVAIAASHFSKEINPNTACQQFVASVSQASTSAQSVLTEAAKAKGALSQINNLLGDVNVPLSSVFDFIRANPGIPNVYQGYFYSQILQGFDDYSDFYNSIEHSPQIANLLGMPVPQLKSILVREFTEFLKSMEIF